MFPVSLQSFFFAVVLTLLQVLVFNHIHIFGYATPMPFVYLVLMLHSNTPRWMYVMWAFVAGIVIDIFSNTLGECAAAMTFLGLIAPRLLGIFSPADHGDEGFIPSPHSMQWSGYVRYVATATFVFTSLFFLMETFSLFDVVRLSLHIFSSSLLTILIVCAVGHLRQSISRG